MTEYLATNDSITTADYKGMMSYGCYGDMFVMQNGMNTNILGIPQHAWSI